MDIDPTQHYRLTTNGEIIFLISIFSSNNVHLAYHMAQRANTGGQTAKLNQRNRIQNLKFILTFLTFYGELVTENINQAARVTWGQCGILVLSGVVLVIIQMWCR